MVNKRQKQTLKDVFVLFGAVSVAVVGIFLILELAIPSLLNCLSMFLALLKAYPLLDFNTKFLGGCFFLVIFWYVILTITRAGLTLAEIGIKESLDRVNKLFKFKNG